VGVKGSQIINIARPPARAVGDQHTRGETSPGIFPAWDGDPQSSPAHRAPSDLLSCRPITTCIDRSPCLGKDSPGNRVQRLANCAPVSGAHVTGKSVASNAMILSLLYKSEPRDLRLIPRRSEDVGAVGVPGHTASAAAVVTDMKQSGNRSPGASRKWSGATSWIVWLGWRNLSLHNFT